MHKNEQMSPINRAEAAQLRLFGKGINSLNAASRFPTEDKQTRADIINVHGRLRAVQRAKANLSTGLPAAARES
ncbi:MAG TPA: hypothetical protein VL306_00940 [Methylomirabilota bacterium]|jgi:hypothetical protein|nr:hypothetical protein [Methylomirabilota bacterium]